MRLPDIDAKLALAGGVAAAAQTEAKTSEAAPSSGAKGVSAPSLKPVADLKAAEKVLGTQGPADAEAPIGYWEGIDGRHGKASPRDVQIGGDGKPVGEAVVRIPRKIDPTNDPEPTRLAKEIPADYAGLAAMPNDYIPVEVFYNRLEALVPSEILTQIDGTLREAQALYEAGLNPEPPRDPVMFRRFAIQSYLHSKDLTTIMTALGYPAKVTGLHDIMEPVPLKDLVWQMGNKLYPPWFEKCVAELEKAAGGDPTLPPAERGLTPDGKLILVNISALGPFAGPMFMWGDSREDANALMDPHRLSPHHNGHSGGEGLEGVLVQPRVVGGKLSYELSDWKEPEESLAAKGTFVEGLRWVEKAVNFLAHHMPREHVGVRHLPRGEWANLEHALATDAAISHSEVGKAICRDAAIVWQKLEEEGKVIPWQKLKLPEGIDTAQFQRAFEAVQAQNAAADKLYQKAIKEADKLAKDGAKVSRSVRKLGQELSAVLKDNGLKAVRELAPTALFDQLVAAKKCDSDGAYIKALGEALAARYAQLACASEDAVDIYLGAATDIEQKLGKDGDYFPAEELKRGIKVLQGLPEAAQQARAQDDESLARTYEEWFRVFNGAFAFPNTPGLNLVG